MGLNRSVLIRLAEVLGAQDVRRIEDNARVAEGVEQIWKKRFDELFDQLLDDLLDTIEEHGEVRWHHDLLERFGALLLEHELYTSTAAANTIAPAEYVRAAKGDRNKWPTDLATIRKLWDQWRRTGKLPGRTAQQAAAIKTLYIRRVQQAWQRYGREFIAGAPRVVGKRSAPDVNQVNDSKHGAVWNANAFDRAGAKAMLEQALAVPRARASTVIETETTRYYNTVRINTYNAIDSVVAYLFVAVRDSATTKWCRSRAGVIFFKGTDGVNGLPHNTPPCHYNCRSELLPLSRLNPAHRRLLEDKRLWAQNRKLEPLLPEWNQHKAA